MLSDTKLKNLKPKEKLYKVADRDGLYVAVSKSGTVSFRYDYRINGRRETLTIGKYGRDGISLSEAREKLIEAKKMLNSGISPATAKRNGIKQIKGEENFSFYTVKYMEHVTLAPSTRALKQSVIDRDLVTVLGNKLMTEITPSMVINLCDNIVSRGGNATALKAREIINSVYQYANSRGHSFVNPASAIKASAIATFAPRNRALKPSEVGELIRTLKAMPGFPNVRLACKLLLLTLSRKSEITKSEWSEINFKHAKWTIPAERMKASREHVIYLSSQALDILVMLQQWAGGSKYVLPARNSIAKHLSDAALNSVLTKAIGLMKDKGIDVAHFTVHDLRRTGSTLLHEAGYPSDWIEKSLAHEQKGVRAIYNKAEYSRQREYMLQQWADMIDLWENGKSDELVPFSPLNFEKWLLSISS